MKDQKIAVAIPTYRRPELLLALTLSLPNHIPISVSDNDCSMSGMSVKFGANVNINCAHQLLPIFANWNRALSLLSPESTHVLIPSDDDLYLPQALQIVEAALSSHPDADMIVFGCDLVDEQGTTRSGWCPSKEQRMEPGDGFLAFEQGVDARMPGVLFRKSFLTSLGGFDERFELTAADSELIQRAALLGRTVFIPETIGLYRIWSGSLTHARQATDQWMDEVALWTGKIAALLESGHHPAGTKIDAVRYRDEIFSRNLLAALGNLLSQGEFDKARGFLRRHPVPARAASLTRLRLLRLELLIWLRAR